MEHLSKIAIILLITNAAFANESLENLAKKSADLRASFKQCGFCIEKRKELESFNEELLIPELERIGKVIQKKSDIKISEKIIDIAISNKESASESFSYALGDAYLSDPKGFGNLVKNLKEAPDRQFIFDQTEWGIQNHTALPKKKMNKVLKELKGLREANK